MTSKVSERRTWFTDFDTCTKHSYLTFSIPVFNNSGQGQGVPAGVIAGGVAGGVAATAVLCVVFAVVYLWKRKQPVSIG